MPEQVIDGCNLCDRDVRYGEECVTVNIHTERWLGAQIDVLSAEASALLCKDCGEKLDGLSLRRVVQQHYQGGGERV